jgi:hypothetical protein
MVYKFTYIHAFFSLLVKVGDYFQILFFIFQVAFNTWVYIFYKLIITSQVGCNTCVVFMVP